MQNIDIARPTILFLLQKVIPSVPPSVANKHTKAVVRVPLIQSRANPAKNLPPWVVQLPIVYISPSWDSVRMHCSFLTRLRASVGHLYTKPEESAIVTTENMSRRLLRCSNGGLGLTAGDSNLVSIAQYLRIWVDLKLKLNWNLGFEDE